MKHGENETVVCREGFASLYGVGTKRVRRIGIAVFEGRSPTDQRGKHNNRPRAVSKDLKQLIEQHIRSFPFQVSHYGRERTKRRYLSSELSVRRMYISFLEKHFPDAYFQVRAGTEPKAVLCHVRHRMYFNYFKENFNYGFGRPRTDVCGTCAEMEVKIQTEKHQATRRKLKSDLELHKRKAKSFYDKLKADSATAEEDQETETLAIDFQQNIPFPHLPVGEIFYMRQLWLYNFCVYSAKTKTSTMYMWPETVAKRGANEVVSCLHHYLQNKLLPGVKKVNVYSDGCRGQNHNQTTVQFFYTLVKTGRFDAVDHNLPIRGHNFLPCDRHFATIEKMKRRREKMEWCDDWINMVEEQFEVVRVTQDLIKDYRGHLAQYFKKATKRGTEKYQVSEYKSFRFRKEHSFEIDASKNMMGLVRTKFRILKPNATPTLEASQCYTSPVPIKAAKKQDVLKLKKYLRQETRDMIDQLLTTEDSNDAQNSDYEN